MNFSCSTDYNGMLIKEQKGHNEFNNLIQYFQHHIRKLDKIQYHRIIYFILGHIWLAFTLLQNLV